MSGDTITVTMAPLPRARLVIDTPAPLNLGVGTPGASVSIAPPAAVRLASASSSVVDVGTTQGVAGVAGAKGDRGDVGPIGPAGATFDFQQGVPSATWTVVHNLGGFPSVTVLDSTEREVIGDVTYIDGNSVRIDFSAPFSGSAHLN